MSHAIQLRALVSLQVAQAERDNKPMGLVMQLATVFPMLGDRVLSRYFEKTAGRLAQQAVWFRGARSWIADDKGEGLTDEDFSLCESLDHFARNVQVLRAHLLDLQAMLSKPNSRRRLREELLEAVRLLLAASSDLFAEVLALKTDVLEHDADRAHRDAGWTASTPEEVRKLFARL
ncbi:hypothetical protein [Rhizobacter sp. P5_C2]